MMRKREKRLGEKFFKIKLYDTKGNIKSTKYGDSYIKDLLEFGEHEEKRDTFKGISIKLNK